MDYTASKAALSRVLHRERLHIIDRSVLLRVINLAATSASRLVGNIRVNAVLPGLIDT
jgi:NAD(P)-dependent dehydrogenase (short-subunit alcohol dehydrogenase family)